MEEPDRASQTHGATSNTRVVNKCEKQVPMQTGLRIQWGSRDRRTYRMQTEHV